MDKGFELKAEYISKYPAVGFGLIDSFCGDLLGSGVFRDVYDYEFNNKYVIKIDVSGEGHNACEYRIWDIVKETEHEKWFAPCLWLSPNGRILIQRKAKNFYDKPQKFLPDKIPAYLTDIKAENFGWIGNQLVCFDYSLSLEKFSATPLSNRMRKNPLITKTEYVD